VTASVSVSTAIMRGGSHRSEAVRSFYVIALDMTRRTSNIRSCQ
jgi:hypothetical protein